MPAFKESDDVGDWRVIRVVETIKANKSIVQKLECVCRTCGYKRTVLSTSLCRANPHKCNACIRAASTRNMPERESWRGARARCKNPKNKSWKYYGGRGIVFADEWDGPGGFERFLAHVGLKPSPSHSIDRIDNDRGYEPGNVRWATPAEQVKNSRRCGRPACSGTAKEW